MSMNSEKNKVFLKVIEEVKMKVSSMGLRDGKKPSFEEYINEIIEDDKISLINFEQHIRAHALAWNGAKLGSTNWKKLVSQIKRTGKLGYNDKKVLLNKNIDEANGIEKKLLKVERFVSSTFRKIDAELVRIVKRLGLLSILVLSLTLYVTFHLIIKYGDLLTYRDINAEIYDLSKVISVVILIYFFAFKGETKNNILDFFRNHLTLKAIIYLIFVGGIYFIIELLN